MLKAGRLRHRIEIQVQQNAQGSIGQTVKVWVKLADTWADYVASSVREFEVSQEQKSELVGRFVLRYREDINNECRIIFRGKVFNVAGVFEDPDSALEYITVPVTSGVNNG